MINGLPKEKEWVSWTYVALWTLVIYLTIPYARPIQIFVTNNWDRDLFGYSMIVFTVAVLVRAFIYLIRLRRPSRGGYIWLAAVAAVQVRYTFRLMNDAPEEAIHFIQYGLLGLLIFRALSHRTRDFTIYFSAALIGGTIGIIDEGIQWATPDRYWAMEDIWLNFFGTALSQIAIAKGIRPNFISARSKPLSIQRFCRVTAVALVLLGISMLNTPARIAWYSERISFLEFLDKNESMMLEYGFRYDDPDIGRFHSRLPPDELARADLERSDEAARILDRFRSDSTYFEFLRLYTPLNDPFLHEARVHLFRRDRHLADLAETGIDDEEYLWRQIVVYRENQIMEKYFPNTFKESSYPLPPELIESLSRRMHLDEGYVSAVSRHLIARFTERQVFGALILVLILTGLIGRHYGNKRVEERR